MTDSLDLENWSALGLEKGQGQQFAQQIQQITSLKVFIKALPKWCQENDTGVVIQITSNPDLDGVGIELAFSQPTLSVAQSEELVDLLAKTNELMELQHIIEILPGLGVEEEIINALVDKANELALSLK